MEWLWIGILIGLAVTFIFISAAVAALARLWRFIGSTGSWRTLAPRWAAAGPVPARALPRQTVQVGRVVYRRCVDVGLSDAGLFLELKGPGRLMGEPALLVPWADIVAVEPAGLYWQSAARLKLGQPAVGTITVYGVVLDAIRPWLGVPPGARQP